jgi:hypothetical protein
MSMIKPRPMPPFPKVTIQPRNRRDRELAKQATRFLNWKLQRSPIRKVSKKKLAWRKLYLLGLAFLMRVDPLCRRCRRRRATEGHHPFGQIGALILIFWPFCRQCHDEVENNKKKARAEGWILYK